VSILHIDLPGRRIVIEKETNQLDRMAIDFSEALRDVGIAYSFVSGYPIILLGRIRTSDDINVVVEQIGSDRFGLLWEKIKLRFECVQTASPETALVDYLLEGSSVRFVYPGEVLPDVEMKFATTHEHLQSLTEAITLEFAGHSLPVSPPELQIAYKLYMGSEKDYEDAKHLFRVMEGQLREPEFQAALTRLGVSTERARAELGWNGP
jgi:hypothetical protein